MIKTTIEQMTRGDHYVIKYQLAGTRKPKWARLVLLDKDFRAGVTHWSGRPGIGNLTFTQAEVIQYYTPDDQSVRATWFNKSEPI